MKRISMIALFAAASVIAAPVAIAGPCDTNAAKAKTPNEQAANPKSSDTDKSSKNLAGGQQPASPGTVGAMNNVSPTGTAGTGQQASGDKEDPGSKNLAGGNQPASPGTVGAMNNAPGASQGTGQAAPKSDDC